MKSFWRRGQAWVIYDNINSATEALKELQGTLHTISTLFLHLFYRHKLFGHVMRINYALEKSDVVSKADGTFVPRPKGPKKPRQILQRELILKQMYSNSVSNNSLSNNSVSNNAMSNNAMSNSGKESFGFTDPVNNSFSMESQGSLPGQGSVPMYQTLTPYNNAYSSGHSSSYSTGVSTGFSSGYSTGFSGGFSDDPSITRRNRVLFVEDLPDGIAHEDVNNLFHHMPGFVETKLINSKHVAFIDFDNEFNSNYALQRILPISYTFLHIFYILQGKLLNGQPIKISFAK
eukprot:XP_763055.1 hypothetical protein [Theileria parva strain Muguga]